MNRDENCVLGLHLCSRGFGWVLFDGPSSAFDWGTADIRRDKNAAARCRIERLLDTYRPEVLAMEQYAVSPAKRSARIRRLYESVARLAEQRGMDVRVLSRQRISDTFAGAKTRDDAAAAIADRIEVLRPRLPKPRRLWESEHRNTALFAAAACALACYAADNA